MKQVKYLATVLIFLQAFNVTGQDKLDASIQKKMNAVENNLISWVKLDSNKNFNIRQRMAELNINGAVVAVIKNYKVEWVKAYGWRDSAEKLPMQTNTLFQAASIGKSLNGFAFMKLSQDDVVNLQEDINHYLKRWKFPYDTVAKGKKISIGNLLSHTAGLTVHGFDGYEWTAPLPNIIQVLDGKGPANNPPVRSAFAPGLKFEYSGGGTMISEMLLEDVTRMDYSEYLRKKILSPLRMSRTSFSTDPIDTNFATAYRFDGKKMEGKFMKFMERACGAAFWTTAGDLANFVIEIQKALEGRSKVLTKSTAEKMLTPWLSGTNAALGFFIDTKKSGIYFQHSGLNPGYASQYYGSMGSGNGVVVLVNSDMTDFMGEVVNAVATVYGWKDFYPFVPKKIITPAPKSLKKYVGSYVFENSNAGPEILLENDQLLLKDPNSPTKWKIYFTSSDEFFMLEAKWANQKFYLDEKNNVGGFYILGESFKAKVIKVK